MVRGMIVVVTALLMLTAGAACRPGERRADPREAELPRRDIQTVQEEQIPALMARPGVVGVAIGALDDGTPCIAVYVATAADSVRLALPAQIEGHPVRVEVTGEIRPLGH